MEVETGGICRECGGKMTYSLHRTVEKLERARSRDEIQLYIKRILSALMRGFPTRSL
jgi:hypothetical protein